MLYIDIAHFVQFTSTISSHSISLVISRVEVPHEKYTLELGVRMLGYCADRYNITYTCHKKCTGAWIYCSTKALDGSEWLVE